MVQAITLFPWRRFAAQPAKWLLRRRLIRNCLQDEKILIFVEQVLRNNEQRLRLPTWAAGRRLQSLLIRLDTPLYRRTLTKAHRAVVRKARTPVLRNYSMAGLAVTHDIRNAAQWHSFIHGSYQAGVREFMLRFSGPESIVVDIGANVGIFTLPLAARMTTGRVYAFEPNPTVLTHLEKGIIDNGLQHRAVPIAVALGALDGDATLLVPKEGVGSATIASGNATTADETLSVKVLRFDNWWQDIGKPPVDVVKIDVEGHEPEVLEGMHELLQLQRTVLIIEISPDWFDAATLLTNLRQQGYELFHILDQPPYHSDLENMRSGKQFNLLAVPAQRLNELYPPKDK